MERPTINRRGATVVNLLRNLIVMPMFGMVGAVATVVTEGCRLAMAQWSAARAGLTPLGILRFRRPVATTGIMAAVLVD